ncbi:putative leader peptide [Pseudonocardia alni]
MAATVATVTGSVLLTTRGHVDLARVASALCRP